MTAPEFDSEVKPAINGSWPNQVMTPYEEADMWEMVQHYDLADTMKAIRVLAKDEDYRPKPYKVRNIIGRITQNETIHAKARREASEAFDRKIDSEWQMIDKTLYALSEDEYRRHVESAKRGGCKLMAESGRAVDAVVYGRIKVGIGPDTPSNFKTVNGHAVCVPV